MTSEYQPVSCDLHSEYELLAMHRALVTVQYLDESGLEQHFHGQVTDLFTREGAEFMKLEGEEGQVEIRLDRIRRLRRH